MLTQQLEEAQEKRVELEERVGALTESSQTEVDRLTEQLSNKSKAGTAHTVHTSSLPHMGTPLTPSSPNPHTHPL